MALRDLILGLDPPPPDEVLRAAHALRYRDFLSVVLVVDRAEVFPDNWIYIHSPEVKLGRIQNYKNWSPHMVPDPAKTALGLEYFLWDSDPEWNWPDEQLIDLGIRECARLGLIRPGEVSGGTVVRAEMAYPIYDHDYRRWLRVIRDYLAHFENLQTIGRNGQHRYNNMDHSMLTGLYAARNMLGAMPPLDVWSVNAEASYHEEGGMEGSGVLEERVVPTRTKAL
jgi:protoporphyrinogen oxidase